MVIFRVGVRGDESRLARGGKQEINIVLVPKLELGNEW